LVKIIGKMQRAKLSAYILLYTIYNEIIIHCRVCHECPRSACMVQKSTHHCTIQAAAKIWSARATSRIDLARPLCSLVSHAAKALGLTSSARWHDIFWVSTIKPKLH